jgi:3-polyprenyl-4-hydroxybenzoate decarboxylase
MTDVATILKGLSTAPADKASYDSWLEMKDIIAFLKALPDPHQCHFTVVHGSAIVRLNPDLIFLPAHSMLSKKTWTVPRWPHRKWPTEGFTRPWPEEIVMDAKTKALVDSKWKALAKELGTG